MATGIVWWTQVCGNTSINNAFWNPDVTINTDNPDFTECFQDTALVWGACGLIWLGALIYVPLLLSRPSLHPDYSTSRLNMAKLMCNCLIVFLLTAEVLLMLFGGKAHALSKWLVPSVYISTMILASYITRKEFVKGTNSSGFMFCSWLVLVLVNCTKLRSTVSQLHDEDTTHGIFLQSPVGFLPFFALILLGFILHLFSDNKALFSSGKCSKGDTSEYEDECPEIKASFLERLLFTWGFSTLSAGYKGKLTKDKIINMPFAQHAQPNVKRIYHNWLLSSKEYSGETKQDKELNSRQTWQKNSSLLMTLVRTYGRIFICASILEAITIMLVYTRPVIMDYLLDFVSTSDGFAWKGYFYASILFLISVLKVLFNQHFVYTRNGLYHRMRPALDAVIYRKCLLISNSARRQYSVGEIINLTSVDIQKVCDGQVALYDLWSAPVQAVVSMWLLYQYVGPSSVVGLTTLSLLIISNFFLITQVKSMNLDVRKLRGKRTKLLSEVLNGIKIIKLYAWERPFQEKISEIRAKEVNLMKKTAYYHTLSSVAFSCAPIFFMVVTFICYILASENATLSAQVAFVTLTLVNSLSSSLGFFPSAVATVVQALQCLHRIEKFLTQGELDPKIIQTNVEGRECLSVTDGTFSWDEEGSGVLKDIELSLQHASLTAVVGQVGCGKSSLLAALLGELHKDSGEVNRVGSIAYVSQEAWLRNQTLRDNVLFNKEMDDNKYWRTLHACALNDDLKLLPDGDMTKIGQKGVTLSGGQKQRVSLARAVYNDADVYVLDDPLSAVDSNVGKHIFEQVIGPNGLLKNKTRILVTHGIAHLPKMDQIIVMKDGRISECGTYDDLITQDGPFAEFMRTYLNNLDEEEQDNDEHTSHSLNGLQKDLEDDMISNIKNNQLRKRKSAMSPSLDGLKAVKDSGKEIPTKSHSTTYSSSKTTDTEKLKDTESTAGKVEWSVLSAYLHNMGCFGILYLISFILVIGCEFGSDIWLSDWFQETNEEIDHHRRLVVYAVLGITTGLMTMLNSVFLAIACYRASTIIHQQLLHRIIRAPMSFFDMTPIGKILHCFSQDMVAADESIGYVIPTILKGSAALTTTVVAISLTSPIFVLAVVPFGVVYYFLQRFHVSTTNQLRRMSIPLTSHLTETISGTASIRAFQQQDIFIREHDKTVDDYTKTRHAILVTNRWFSVWLMFWSALIVFLAALLAVMTRSSVSVGLAALSISYAIKISDSLAIFARISAELENHVISLERIQEFSSVEQEAPWHVDAAKHIQESWPDVGKITLHQFSTRYRSELDLVLNEINCVFNGGEKIGIVGRTGAGKSSMTLSLFRIIEAADGNIVIDDIVTSKIGLHDLRTKLTIIPQDPVIFSGSLRFNLDPFNDKTDDEIYTALGLVHLKSFVMSLPDKLEYECAESGSNLSVGQKQLVCLARALLRKTKVLVLDEATAAVDLETDELIQKTIRTQFNDCTVITIAHRINTVLDYDRIMVMKMGRIAEFDTPSNLMDKKDSEFYKMCKDAGLAQ